jgi:hypothetical protein
MGLLTSRMSLFKATRGNPSDDIISVTADFDNNFTAIDNTINAGPYTSTARPTNPYQGQLIYETDTGYVRIWDGTTWTIRGYKNQSLGWKQETLMVADGANQTSGNNEVMTPLTATFTSELGRRYWVETICWFNLVSGSAHSQLTQQIRWKAGGTVSITDTQVLPQVTHSCGIDGTGATNSRSLAGLWEFVPNIAGQVTVGLSYTVITASRTVSLLGTGARESYLLVRDVGI